MKIQLALLTSFLFSYVWSENTDLFEDLIDPSDMLHYNAVSQSMRNSKQTRINAMLKQYLQRTLEYAEKLGQPTVDEDVQYHAEITFNSQILKDFLKCIKESDCDPTILEKHLQNIHLRLKTYDESEYTLPIVFDRILEVAIFFYILVGFLDLVKTFNLFEWLVCIITLVGKLYWVCDFEVFTGFLKQWEHTIEDISIIIYLIIVKVTVTLALKCFKKIFHKKQQMQIQRCPEDFEELNFPVPEKYDASVNGEEPVVKLNQELCSSQSPERPQERSESSNDGFKNSEKDRKQLLKQLKGPEVYIGSTSTAGVLKLLDNDNQHGPKDLSDDLRETSKNLDPSIEETIDSLSFMVIEEEEDS